MKKAHSHLESFSLKHISITYKINYADRLRRSTLEFAGVPDHHQYIQRLHLRAPSHCIGAVVVLPGGYTGKVMSESFPFCFLVDIIDIYTMYSVYYKYIYRRLYTCRRVRRIRSMILDFYTFVTPCPLQSTSFLLFDALYSLPSSSPSSSQSLSSSSQSSLLLESSSTHPRTQLILLVQSEIPFNAA